MYKISVYLVFVLQKPLVRVEIEEIGFDDDASRQTVGLKPTDSETKRNTVIRDNDDFQKFTAASPAEIGKLGRPMSNGDVISDNVKTGLVTEVTQNGIDTAQPVVKSSIKVCDNKTLQPKSETTKVKKGKKATQQTASKTSVTGDKSATNVTSVQDIPVPTTSVQFQADYRRLKSDLNVFYKYFQVSYDNITLSLSTK